jgi:hypothetical protein
MFLAITIVANGALGQIWTEIGDAPDGVPGQQVTMGMGPLTEIRGSLDRTGGDHVDTYCMVVNDPAQFFASTNELLGGSFLSTSELLADTRLWLWTQSSLLSEGMAMALLGNDDDPSSPNTGASTMNIMLNSGQQYLVSISTFANNAYDAASLPLIHFMPGGPGALFGPNPDPLTGPFQSWENAPTGEFGNYVIALRGASFCAVPEPTTGGVTIVFLAILALGRRQLERQSRSPQAGYRFEKEIGRT